MITVRLEAFEGPFDLLFHLIEKNQINIYDIPIAELTDQYIAHIRSFPEGDLESVSRFLYMAAALLEIKSKMLLPSLPKEGEEEQPDPREELVAKLIEYKRFKHIAALLKEREALGQRYIYKEGEKEILLPASRQAVATVCELLEETTMESLYRLFQDVILRRELKVDKIRSGFDSVPKDIFTVEEKIDCIKALLTRRQSLIFTEIFAEASGITEKVVIFLAMLELIKMKEIKVEQAGIFDEIVIRQF